MSCGSSNEVVGAKMSDSNFASCEDSNNHTHFGVFSSRKTERVNRPNVTRQQTKKII